jgi:hypothetical protein
MLDNLIYIDYDILKMQITQSDLYEKTSVYRNNDTQFLF